LNAMQITPFTAEEFGGEEEAITSVNTEDVVRKSGEKEDSDLPF